MRVARPPCSCTETQAVTPSGAEAERSASDGKAEAAPPGLLVGAVGLVRGELDVRLAQAHVLGVSGLGARQLLNEGHCLQCI